MCWKFIHGTNESDFLQISRSGILLFPIDLNDIQHGIVISDDSENESTCMYAFLLLALAWVT